MTPITRRILAICAAVLVLPAQAQDMQTCDSIKFDPAITERYPEIGDACIDVVIRDDKQFAKLRIEVVKPRHNGMSFRFLHADGEYGPTQSIGLAADWRATIDGKVYRTRDLLPGQQLSIYMPPDSWVGHVESEPGLVIVNYDFLELEDVADAVETDD